MIKLPKKEVDNLKRLESQWAIRTWMWGKSSPVVWCPKLDSWCRKAKRGMDNIGN